MYVRPEAVLGSTRVKMLEGGRMTISGAVGYLKDLLGPCG